MARVKYGKISRAAGVALHPKADKILTRRQGGPGQHGAKGRRKVSEYALRLREKQKLRRTYGMNEAQFRRFFTRATKQKGVTGEMFLKSLEMRLDNVVYRLNLAPSRPGARQLVSHGHILVNGKKIDVSSYVVKAGEVISVKEKSHGSAHFKALLESIGAENVPGWLKLDPKKLSGTVVNEPTREDLDPSIQEQLIIEFYSR